MDKGTTWKFYLRPEDVWETMLKDIATAKTSIDIEQYIFINDKVGERFLNALKKKAGAGVKVRLLCDAVGSLTNLNLFDTWGVVGSGIEVQFFNPLKPWLPSNILKFFLRDHKKLMIVDGVVGYTGGVGIWAKMSGWRDTHIRIKGPVISQMQQAFNAIWEVTSRGRRFMKFQPTVKTHDNFRFVTNAPRVNQRFIYHELIEAVRAAEKYIYLTTPYFIPDHRLLRVLRLAVRRRVEVKLLIPEASDVELADIACRSYIATLLKAGIHVYLYQKGVMHAKTIVIDDRWGTIGSINLDNFSLRFNYEGNIISNSEKFNIELKQHFLQDIRESRELNRSEWNQRPAIQQFKEWIIWPLRKVL